MDLSVKPRMFIGSSVEGANIARAVEANLQHTVDCVVWTNAFPLAKNTIDSLVAEFAKVDFGLFVLSPDDHSLIRNKDHITARDNVIFEAGLFMGRHGLERTFLVKPRGIDEFHMPTDLIGITTATYDVQRAKTEVRSALSTAATEVDHAIREIRKQENKLDCHSFAREEPSAHWKLKAYVQITNNTQTAVALRSLDMDLAGELALETDFKRIKLGKLVPEFDVGLDAKGHGITKDSILVHPGDRAQVWFSILPSIGILTVKRLLDSSTFGIWRCEEHWLDNRGHSLIRVHKI